MAYDHSQITNENWLVYSNNVAKVYIHNLNKWMNFKIIWNNMPFTKPLILVIALFLH